VDGKEATKEGVLPRGVSQRRAGLQGEVRSIKGGGDVRRRLGFATLVATFAIVATACGGGGGGGASPSASGVVKGGVLREAYTSFGWTNGFDPTGEYLSLGWSWYANMLTRGLVNYPFVAGAAGNKVVPDIAADGLTYTFTLRPGVMFGPPVNREITSKDILYAFQRINTKSLIAQYGNYYCGTIVGMTCDAKNPDQPIAGITTPNDSTIVFKLERPTGDFLFRLAMPATNPIPREVAKCFTRAGDYGRYVISSGPYMIQGSDKLDISSCSAMKKTPISGYDPDKFMYLTRNPNWKKSTDPNRDANFDGFTYVINTNLDDIYNKVQQGDLDLVQGAVPPAILQQYLTNADLKDRLKIDEGDRTWYLTMNLLVPPFDDVHVRKAANLVVDKAAMFQAAGGSSSGEIATSVEPPSVLPETATYDPYATPNHAGDVTAAQAEMKLSKYDTNGDGKCDAAVCNGVVLINRNYTPWSSYSPILTQDFKAIGINLKVRELDISTAYTTIQTESNLIPISSAAGWGKDYGSPYGFDYFLFSTAGIACSGNINYSNVGMTKAQAAECGPAIVAAWNAVTKNGANPLPSVDDDMAKCVSTPAGTAYQECWANLDKRLMEEIVPWVPYRWATNQTVLANDVTHWEYDQSAGQAAYAHLAVNNGLTMEQVTGAA
jgi:peptide/nickel transport system substrate-binding protein